MLFDVKQLRSGSGRRHLPDHPTPGVRYRGFWLEYNGLAAKDAEEKTRAFLDAHLAEISPGEPTKN